MYSLLRWMVNSIFNIAYPNKKLINGDETKKDSLNFWKDVFLKNKIAFEEIVSVSTIIACDYSENFLKSTISSIEKNLKLDMTNAVNFTWNKPHLHFELIVMDKAKYAGAVIYPFELMESPKVLWLHLLKPTDLADFHYPLALVSK